MGLELWKQLQPKFDYIHTSSYFECTDVKDRLGPYYFHEFLRFVMYTTWHVRFDTTIQQFRARAFARSIFKCQRILQRAYHNFCVFVASKRSYVFEMKTKMVLRRLLEYTK